jgi:hypothetical protein
MTLQAETPLVRFLMVMISLSGEHGKCRNGHKEFFLDYLNLEDGTDRLSRNVGDQLVAYAA